MLPRNLRTVLNSKNYVQLAISYKSSNWCHLGETKENGRAWACVLLNLELLSRNNINYDIKCLAFEDYDLTAQILRKGLKNIIYYRYAFENVPMAKNKGGMENYYKNETKKLKEVCEYLKQKYNSNEVKIFFNKTHNIYEPQFYWSKIKAVVKHGWW